MKDGHAVITNIPQSCFRDGVMTCWNYHPLAGNQEEVHSQKKVKESNISMEEPLIQIKDPGAEGEK